MFYCFPFQGVILTWRWRYNGHDGISKHQPHIIYSTVYSGADQSKHQSSTSLAFVWGIHRGPVNSPHKWPVTRKMFPFDDVIMESMPFYMSDVFDDIEWLAGTNGIEKLYILSFFFLVAAKPTSGSRIKKLKRRISASFGRLCEYPIS